MSARAALRQMANGTTPNDLYIVTLTGKPPKLTLPDPPPQEDNVGLCGWLTSVLRLDCVHPVTAVVHQGSPGQDGHVVVQRAGGHVLRFEPAAAVNTARRFLPALTWQLLATDGEPYSFKDEHCRRIAFVMRQLSTNENTITTTQETAGIIGTFTYGAVAIEGYTVYGTTAQRYEAVEVLRRELDANTGRPIGPPRYLIDANTGELVIRVGDLQAAARAHLGESVRHDWLDAKVEDYGWRRCRLQGYAIPGRVGRTGPHARVDVYRGYSQVEVDDLEPTVAVNT